jgi:hypothetical protein
MNKLEQDNLDIPVTIKTFCQSYSWPSEPAMRAYRQRSKELNLTDAFLTVRRRVLVRPKTFFRLIEQYHKQPGGDVDEQKSANRTSRAGEEAS